MIVEKALHLAGEGAHLVARPAGRVHVYVGPLTPSGRFVPRSARTVCRARTRRLSVVKPVGSSLQLGCVVGGGVCALCSARLASRPRRAEHTPAISRDDWVTRYAGYTRGDVAFALEVAQTPAEVDAAAHLSLLLFTVAGCNESFTDRGRTWPALHHLVVAARHRVRGYPAAFYENHEREAAISASANAARVAARRADRAEREARIARVGFVNANPEPPRRPPRSNR